MLQIMLDLHTTLLFNNVSCYQKSAPGNLNLPWARGRSLLNLCVSFSKYMRPTREFKTRQTWIYLASSDSWRFWKRSSLCCNDKTATSWPPLKRVDTLTTGMVGTTWRLSKSFFALFLEFRNLCKVEECQVFPRSRFCNRDE